MHNRSAAWRGAALAITFFTADGGDQNALGRQAVGRPDEPNPSWLGQDVSHAYRRGGGACLGLGDRSRREFDAQAGAGVAIDSGHYPVTIWTVHEPVSGLDDPLWVAVPHVTLVDAQTGTRPAFGTTVQVVRDRTAVWVRFECVSYAVKATLTRPKDLIWTEDAVEVFFWQEGSGELIEIQVSPRGLWRDLLVWDPFTRKRRFDDSWSCAGLVTQAAIVRDAGRVTGWRALLGMPWESAVMGGSAARLRLGLFRIDRHPLAYSALRAGSPFVRFHDPELLLRVQERSF